MTRVKKAFAVIGSVLFAIFAFIIGKRKLSEQKRTPEAPPENHAANAALDAVQETFEQEVDRVKAATTSDTPADDLADLGNARRR